MSLPKVLRVQQQFDPTHIVDIPAKISQEISKLNLSSRIKPGDTVIDLGSGDGRIMITAAQKYGARGFGVELNPRLVESSNEAAKTAGVADRVKFLQQDLFKTDFREADVLTLYLLPDVNMALRPKILADLRPGTRVVSHDYGMGLWRPEVEETIPAPDKTVGVRKESTVYLWIVPAPVEGTWRWNGSGSGPKEFQLKLRQQFQKVDGQVELDGRPGQLRDVKLNGDQLTFTVLDASGARRDFSGRVSGNSIQGAVKSLAGSGDAKWSATRAN